MKANLFNLPSFRLFVVALLFAGSRSASAQQAVPPMPAEELPAGSQVLASGPVHEAFAKPVSVDPQAPIVVPNQPPSNLQEVPPAEKPDGSDIVWVPGYWAWDADRNDFIWVSGCWRNAPPNTYWIPGHWLQVNNGWEWIGGFWKAITAQPQQEIEYLPAPPAAVEAEPPESPPQPDQIWVPGCWYWVQGQYVRRHGYWMAAQVGWVWVPSHYAWTPRGYIFCPGHWDYDLDNRGVLFTPAYFPPDVRVRAGFVYSPSVCVDLGILRLNLFAYPRYRHYYFGDYYDDGYRRVGIYPWYQCQTVHAWYDPIFVYDRWHYQRTDPHWAANQARQYARLRSNRDLRPARTFAGLQAQMVRLPANRRPERPLVQSVRTYAASQSTPIKFERITAAERQQIAAKSTEVRQLREQRNRWEGPASTAAPVAEHRPAETKAAPVTEHRPAETKTAPVTEHRPVEGTKAAPVTEHRPAETKAAPVTEHRPVAESRVGPAVAANPPVAHPAAKSTKEARQPQAAPAPAVRVTSPERVVLPNPPSVAKPSESRYIEKQPPSHPVEERSRTEPNAPRGTSSQDAQRDTRPGDSKDKNRQR